MFTSCTVQGEAIGAFQGELLYRGSLDTAQYRSLLHQNEFAVLSHVVEDPAPGGGRTIWLAQFR